MSNLISRMFPNAIYIALVLGLASILLSVFANDALAKAAFIGATSYAAGCFTLCMAFIGQQVVEGNKWSNAFNFNVWAVLPMGLIALAVVFLSQDVSLFADSVFENVVAGTVASGMALAMKFAGGKD